MKRGEIWTAAAGSGYGGKPRPAAIIQNDSFDTDSITICAFSTDPTEAPGIRLLVEPNDENGLKLPSRLMVDKVMTVPRTKLGRRIGELGQSDLAQLQRALVVFLGVAG